MRKLKIFGTEGRGPCESLKELIENGQIGIEGLQPGESFEVEYHDVGTDQDFHFVQELDLERLPSVHLDGRECRIVLRNAAGQEVDPGAPGGEDVYAVISCPLEGPEGSESPPGEDA